MSSVTKEISKAKVAPSRVLLGKASIKYALGAFAFDFTKATMYQDGDDAAPIISFGLSTFLQPFGHFVKGDQGWVELVEDMFVVWGDEQCEKELLNLPVAAILWPELNIGKDPHSPLRVREVQRLKRIIQTSSNVKNLQEIAELRENLPPAKEGENNWGVLVKPMAKINAQQHPLPWAEKLLANLTAPSRD